MATVTLKDLMNPLTKLVNLSEETDKKVDELIQVVTSTQSVGVSLQRSILNELKLQTQLLKSKENTGLSSIFSSEPNKTGANLTEGANALRLLGASTFEVAKGLLAFSLVPKRTVSKFNLFISDFFKNLTEFKDDDVKKGAESLGILGDSILKFSKALALSAVLLIPGMIAIPFLILSIGTVGLAMAGLGLADKQINRGARALDRIGKGIQSFAIGLALFGLTTMFIMMVPKVLLGMAASITIIGGAVAILGLVNTQANKGAVSLGLIGIGLGIFSVGYSIFALATKNLEWEDIGKQAAILGGIGLVTALLGVGLSLIAQGAISIALIGVSLIPFSIGYAIFTASTKGITDDMANTQLSILGGIGIISTLTGVGVALTGGAALLGPVLFAAAGVSLLILAPGLAAIKKLDFGKDDSDKLSYTLGAVAMAFSGTDPEAGFFKNVGNVFGRVVESGGMAVAAAGYAAAGGALSILSRGLLSYKDLKWTDVQSKELANMLTSISVAFASAAGDDEPIQGGGFIGTVFGVKRTRVEEGIRSVMDAGKALTKIAKGLKSFQDLINSGVKFGDPEDPTNNYGGKDTLAYAVINTVGFVQKAFSAVADEGTVNAGGFFNTLYEIKKNKVAEGIDSVMDAGKALTRIAEGLKSFQDLINSEVKFGDPNDEENDYGGKDTLAYAVINTVGFVQQAFAAVGNEENVNAGGFFNSLFGIKKNKVAEGIDSVKGAGKELLNIAEGLKSFQELVEKEVDFSEGGKLETAVKKSLGFVGDAFADIGGKKEKDGWFVFKWDDNLVSNGVAAVKGAGAALNDIAKGLKSFQDLINSEVKFGDPNDKENDYGGKDTLAYAVINTVGFVGDAFASIGGKKQEDSALFGLIKWDENLVKQGIENVEGAGAALNDIAKGLISFSELEDPTKVAQSVKSLLESMSGTFSSFYDQPEFSTRVTNFSGFILTLGNVGKTGYLNKAADGFQKIANAINSVNPEKAAIFRDLFKATSDMGTNRRTEAALAALVEAIEEIRDTLSDENSGIGSQIGGAFEGLKGALGFDNTEKSTTETPPNLGAVLTRIESTLARMNTTLTGLPGDIASIEIRIPSE